MRFWEFKKWSFLEEKVSPFADLFLKRRRNHIDDSKSAQMQQIIWSQLMWPSSLTYVFYAFLGYFGMRRTVIAIFIVLISPFILISFSFIHVNSNKRILLKDHIISDQLIATINLY